MKNNVTNQLRQQDAQTLAKGYTPLIRIMDVASIVTFMSLEGLLVYQLWGNPHVGPWLLLSAVLLGYLGHSTHKRSGCFSRPARSPASGPQPAK